MASLRSIRSDAVAVANVRECSVLRTVAEDAPTQPNLEIDYPFG
jgi:hypothetical protein